MKQAVRLSNKVMQSVCVAEGIVHNNCEIKYVWQIGDKLKGKYRCPYTGRTYPVMRKKYGVAGYSSVWKVNI